MCLIGFRILCHSQLLCLFSTRRVSVCVIMEPGIALCVVVAFPFVSVSVCMCQRAGFHFIFILFYYYVEERRRERNMTRHKIIK